MGLSIRVIETRAYIRAYKKLKDAEQHPEDAEFDESDPMLDLVRDISAEAEYELDADNIEEVRAYNRALRAEREASQST